MHKNSMAMTIEYRLTADQLSNTVENTIRAFDEYSLRKKPDSSERQVIMDRSWMGTFHYFISETPYGSKLTVEAVAAKPVPQEVLIEHEEVFLKNVFKIISKEIAVTPEIAGSSLYKKPVLQIGIRNIIWMILVILLLFKIFQGCMKG
ncbi:MAG TPA: hypothetical protein VFE04_05925 [Puia sp.]|nr:hypothetical protein [Puia sp.]